MTRYWSKRYCKLVQIQSQKLINKACFSQTELSLYITQFVIIIYLVKHIVYHVVTSFHSLNRLVSFLNMWNHWIILNLCKENDKTKLLNIYNNNQISIDLQLKIKKKCEFHIFRIRTFQSWLSGTGFSHCWRLWTMVAYFIFNTMGSSLIGN